MHAFNGNSSESGCLQHLLGQLVRMTSGCFFFSQELCVMEKTCFFQQWWCFNKWNDEVALKVPNPQGPFEVEYGRGELPSWFTLLIETCDTTSWADTSKLTSLNVKHLIFSVFGHFKWIGRFKLLKHEISSMLTFYRKLMGAMLIDVNYIVVLYGTISPISLPKIPEFVPISLFCFSHHPSATLLHLVYL